LMKNNANGNKKKEKRASTCTARRPPVQGLILKNAGKVQKNRSKGGEGSCFSVVLLTKKGMPQDRAPAEVNTR